MRVHDRKPNTKWIDRSGTVTEHGLEILSWHGFGVTEDGRETSFSVWNVRCPYCKNVYQAWGTTLSRNRSCGCHKRQKVDPALKTLRRQWHERKRMNHLEKSWLSFDRFAADCGPQWFAAKNPKLIPKDKRKPLGPGNFVIVEVSAEQGVLRTYGKRYGINGKFLTTRQACEILGVSRQRVHQMEDHVVERKILEKLIGLGQAPPIITRQSIASESPSD